MRFFNVAILGALIAALLVCYPFGTNASEDLLVIEQDYTIAGNAKDGVNGKDVRQVMYVTRDMIAIDEFGDNGKTPTETYQIDLKNQRIVNLDHAAKQILVNETFAARRAAILQQKQRVEREVGDLPEGAAKKRIVKMYGPMLDTDRVFMLFDDRGTKDVAGIKCKLVKIVDAKDTGYPAFEAALHPDMDMPFDNSEVLFLLKIVGEKMAQFLKDNKAVFARVPMEMHLQTAEGGKLDTKVVSVKKSKLGEYDFKSRMLGDPFAVPKDYALIRKFTPKPTDPKTEKPD